MVFVCLFGSAADVAFPSKSGPGRMPMFCLFDSHIQNNGHNIYIEGFSPSRHAA